jgi:dimethylaniline monooxygenase (N-oxide forming)
VTPAREQLTSETTEPQAGATGLSMLKTLREDGFSVTLFERRNQVGGLWSYSDDTTMTSILSSRQAKSCCPTCSKT